MTPTTQKPYSIQRQLLNSLLIGLPIIWLSITLISVWRLSHEINEINDTQITQLARYLIGISQDVKLHLTNPANEPKILNLENGLLSGDLGDAEEDYMGFAIWDQNGKLLMADKDGQHFTFLPKQHGFLENNSAYQELNPFSHSWRLFYAHDDATNHLIAIGQNLNSRQEIIYKSLTIQLVPSLIGVMLLIMLTWLSVRRGFVPLKRISDLLSTRSPEDKTPLSVDTPLEIQPLLNALNGLFDKVADTLEREKRFTADASHELRSPLTAIKLQTDVLQQTILQANLTDSQTDALLSHCRQISHSNERANRLVEQLLILAKLAPQQGLDPQTFAAIDWIALSNDILSEVNRRAREKNSQLRRDVLVDAKAILPLTGNATLIGILLRNLLDNAIRYSPDHTTIRLVLDSEVISVIDNGNGVAPIDLARLSERFFRPAGQAEIGSGLGLSIVRRIAELHGLQITMQNLEHNGQICGFQVSLFKR